MKITLGYILDEDEISFKELFNIYYPPLCVFAKNYIKNDFECEDIVQEAFAMLWAKRNRIVIGSSIKNYLVSMVRNLCIDHIRSDRHFKEYMDHCLNSSQSSSGVSPDELYTMAELKKMLNDTLESLPETYRTVFEMSRFDKMTYEEISRQLGISVRSAKRYRDLAEKTLTNELKKSTGK